MTNHKRAEALNSLELRLADEAATVELGGRLAATLAAGLKIYLHGDLGAGKTTLSRALLQALGHTGRVKSPTYTLVEVYGLSRLNLYHFDFYRFRDAQEWREAGFSDYFGGDAVCLVEWPEKAGDDLPPADLDIFIAMVGNADGMASNSNDERHVEIIARTEEGQRCVVSLTASYSPASSS
jgi:tRNA threonylcarbamoyladenosine biosynthesis protein TsaE